MANNWNRQHYLRVLVHEYLHMAGFDFSHMADSSVESGGIGSIWEDKEKVLKTLFMAERD